MRQSILAKKEHLIGNLTSVKQLIPDYERARGMMYGFRK